MGKQMTEMLKGTLEGIVLAMARARLRDHHPPFLIHTLALKKGKP